MKTEYVVLLFVVLAVLGYFGYKKYYGSYSEGYLDFALGMKVNPVMINKSTGKEVATGSHYSVKSQVTGQPINVLATANKAFSTPIYPRGVQGDVGPMLRQQIGSESSSEDYVNLKCDSGACPDNVFHNQHAGAVVDHDGMDPDDEVVITDRIMYAPKKSRQREGSDYIRGDLPICPNENIGWFNVSVNPLSDLNQGVLSHIAGRNEASQKLDDYVNKLHAEKVSYTHNETYLDNIGQDVIVLTQ